MFGQPLLGTHTVDGQLQRASPVRRPAELVVDQAERPIGEEIEPVSLATKLDDAGAVRRLHDEAAAQRMLEQPLDHRYRPFRLHAEYRLTQTCRR